MKTALWLALPLGLSCQAAFIGPNAAWEPIPLASSPFQLDKRGGRSNEQPVNIDLLAWKPGPAKLQWYGEITAGTPPQKL
jgi:hypothetical protein